MMRTTGLIWFLILPPETTADGGALECPCLNSTSAQYAAISAASVSRGLSATYGLEGCKAYDANISLTGCDGASPPEHCGNFWCYIDLDLCPKRDDLCIANGGVPGSYTSPYCRTRDYVSSESSPGYLSYETCGSINVYNVSLLTADVEGHVLQISVIPSSPWVIDKTSPISGLKKFGGPSYDFFVEALECIQPNVPTVKIAADYATAGSRAKFPSSDYTACVHDVAVGNLDMCVADLWLTPERNQLATFLPALRQDFFYLVVPQKIEEVTFWSRLIRPFMPFTEDGWLGIGAFLCSMATVLWILHVVENGWEGCNMSVVGWIRFQFAIWHDFLLGGGNVQVEKGPVYKFLHLSFAFFILVALASYAASLASMLVIQRDAAGAVKDIYEAIDQDYRICAPSALVETFESVFGKVFVPHADYMAGPRNFYAGNCEGMVLSQDLIDQLYAGQIKDKDCAEVASGSITDAEGRCHSDHRGSTRVDCHLVKAGDLIWSIPLSFPVRTKIAHPVSWAFIKSQTSGAYARNIEANQHSFPSSKCVAEDRTEEEGLNLGDLSGMIFISLFIAIFGLLIHAGTLAFRRLKPDAPSDDPNALWAVPPPDPKAGDPEAPAVPEKLLEGT